MRLTACSPVFFYFSIFQIVITLITLYYRVTLIKRSCILLLSDGRVYICSTQRQVYIVFQSMHL